MISYLIGKPVLVNQQLLVLTGGVGYGVFVTNSTLSAIQNQEQIELHIYDHIREDRFDLYGFLTPSEKELFLLLLSVSGVGPNTALHIMEHKPIDVIEAVQQANPAFFASVPRVGKKVAQKIIIELSSKLGQLKVLDLGPESSQKQEVRLALSNLGFDENSIELSLQQIEVESIPVEQAIKQALKFFARK